jgi:hypothetical protein
MNETQLAALKALFTSNPNCTAEQINAIMNNKAAEAVAPPASAKGLLDMVNYQSPEQIKEQEKADKARIEARAKMSPEAQRAALIADALYSAAAERGNQLANLGASGGLIQRRALASASGGAFAARAGACCVDSDTRKRSMLLGATANESRRYALNGTWLGSLCEGIPVVEDLYVAAVSPSARAERADAKAVVDLALANAGDTIMGLITQAAKAQTPST